MESSNFSRLSKGPAIALNPLIRDDEQVDAKSFHLEGAASKPGFLLLVAPSFLLCFAIFAGLIAVAGVWEVAAGSRLLSALLSGGIIALSEDDAGLGTGVPGLHYFVQSQELITWSLVLMSSALFITVSLLKALQFRKIALLLGIGGTLSEHFRAYFYGHGIERMLPYKVGEVAWAAALEDQDGATLDQSARLALIFRGFLLFEIFSFALIGLFMSGLLAWGTALVPPLVILGISWLLRRSGPSESAEEEGFWTRLTQVFEELTHNPQALTGLALLSLLSFALVELATYIVPQAFSTLTVPLIWDELRFVVLTPSVIVMAVVAGYIARLIPITPGGAGQFELAFAFVLMANGLPFTPAVIVTLLVSFVRYGTGLFLFSFMMLVFGIGTSFGRVLELFERDQVKPDQQQPSGE